MSSAFISSDSAPSLALIRTIATCLCGVQPTYSIDLLVGLCSENFDFVLFVQLKTEERRTFPAGGWRNFSIPD